MKKGKTNNFYKIGFYSILAVLIILILLPQVFPQQQIQKTNAELVAYTSDWFINVENQDQIVFFVSLANYGYTASEDTTIACELYEQNPDGSLVDNVADYITTETLEIVEKTSTTEVAVTGLGITNINQQVPYTGICKIESCKNCEVLTERLIE